MSMKEYAFTVIRDYLDELERHIERIQPANLTRQIERLEKELKEKTDTIVDMKKENDELKVKIAEQGIRIGRLLPPNKVNEAGVVIQHTNEYS